MDNIHFLPTIITPTKSLMNHVGHCTKSKHFFKREIETRVSGIAGAALSLVGTLYHTAALIIKAPLFLFGRIKKGELCEHARKTSFFALNFFLSLTLGIISPARLVAIHEKHHLVDKLANLKKQLGQTPKEAFARNALGRLIEEIRIRRDDPAVIQTLKEQTDAMHAAYKKEGLDALCENFAVWQSTTFDGLKLQKCRLVEDSKAVNRFYFQAIQEESLVSDTIPFGKNNPSDAATEKRYKEGLEKYQGETHHLPKHFVSNLIHDVTINSSFREKSGEKYLSLILNDLHRTTTVTVNGNKIYCNNDPKPDVEIYQKCLAALENDKQLSQNALILTTQAALVHPSVHMMRFSHPHPFSDGQEGMQVQGNADREVTILTTPNGKTIIEQKVTFAVAPIENRNEVFKQFTATLRVTINTKDLKAGKGSSGNARLTYSRFFDPLA